MPFVLLVIAAAVSNRSHADETQQLRAQQQIMLAEKALASGNLSEALTWFAHVFQTAPDDTPIRTSARNMWNAYSDSAPRTLVHPETVHEVAVSPDGETLWAAFLASKSQLWDLTTGKPIGKPLTHAGDVCEGQFTPDGKFILTADWEGAVLWEVATGKPAFPMIAHELREDTVRPPAISPDGATIITRDTLKSVRLWNAKTGKPLCDSISTAGTPWRMTFSSDGLIVAVRAGGEILILESKTGKRVGEPLRGVSDMAFHPDNKTMAVCDKGKVHLRDIYSGMRSADLEHEEPLTEIQFDLAGKTLLAYKPGYDSKGETTVVWKNVGSNDREKIVHRHQPGLRQAVLSPSGTLVAISDRFRLRVWKTSDGSVAWEQTYPSAPPVGFRPMFGALEFSPNGGTLMACGKSEVFLFRSDRGWLLAQEKNIRVTGFSPDGQTLVCGTEDNFARLISATGRDPRFVTTLAHPGGSRDVTRAVFSTDGKLVVTAGRDKIVQMWDTATWKAKGDPIKLVGSISGIAIGPDNDRLAVSVRLPKPPSASVFDRTPGQLELYSMKDRKRIGDPIGFAKGVYGPHLDSVGDYIYASSGRGNVLCNVMTGEVLPVSSKPNENGRTVASMLSNFQGRPPRLWNTKTGAPARVTVPKGDFATMLICQSGDVLALNHTNELQLFSGTTGKPTGPLFKVDGRPFDRSPNGRYVLCGDGYDVQLWDAVTGKRCGDPLAETHVQMATAFSLSGDMLATYQSFNTKLWDCATGQVLGPNLQNRSTGEYDLEFSPDGKWLLSVDGRANVFRVSAEASDADSLRLTTEVRSGLRIDGNGSIQKLRYDEWLNRVEKLSQEKP